MKFSVIQTVLFFAVAFAASWTGVLLFRRWSIGRNLLDIPNDRSSHSTPTPRGGGLVIAFLGLLGYAIAALVFDATFSWGFFLGAALIAIVSWLDDLYSLPFWSRLIVHIAAAVILVADVGVWTGLSFPTVAENISMGTVVGGLITIGWVVWLVNAYNFMDGIDGIAALQATLAGIAWGVVALSFGLPGLLLLAGLISSVSLGFLIHNWQPAKIFMGDVGSAFLGFALASLPLLARNEANVAVEGLLPLLAILFVWFFVFDTVFTLLKRLASRKRVWEAHREHLYQALVIGGMSHAKVTIIYGISAAILSGFVSLSLVFGGKSWLIALLSLVVLTALIMYGAVIKKR